MFGLIIKTARKQIQNANYFKSNSHAEVRLKPTPAALRLTMELLCSSEANKRQELGVALLDELSDGTGIDIVELIVSDENQAHRRRGTRIVMKKYGSYRPSNKTIMISNRTAARGQILAPKSFLDTLLHEWVHHYDTHKLRINSIHSKGFYDRLNDLKTKLQVPKQK